MLNQPPDLIMPLELAIILPTLNERDNIAGMVDRLHDALGPAGWEAIFVDDASADGTADLIREIGKTDPRIRVIERIGRRGLASAAIEGMCATAAPFAALMDADHQHDPAMLTDMVEAVRSDRTDVAVASRFITGADASGLATDRRQQVSGLGNRIAQRITGADLTDPMSGYFVLKTKTVRVLAPRLSGIGFKLLLDILSASRPALRVQEFPMQFAARQSGESKLDHAVAFEFLAGLYDRTLGQIIPTRFAMFGTVGALGVAVHLVIFAGLFYLLEPGFIQAQAAATFGAMTFNFWLNNWLTYRDVRLRGMRAVFIGWISFCATCAVGAVANVAVAALLEARGIHALAAVAAGIIVGAVWNYALSSRFVWGKF